MIHKGFFFNEAPFCFFTMHKSNLKQMLGFLCFMLPISSFFSPAGFALKISSVLCLVVLDLAKEIPMKEWSILCSYALTGRMSVQAISPKCMLSFSMKQKLKSVFSVN